GEPNDENQKPRARVAYDTSDTLRSHKFWSSGTCSFRMTFARKDLGALLHRSARNVAKMSRDARTASHFFQVTQRTWRRRALCYISFMPTHASSSMLGHAP